MARGVEQGLPVALLGPGYTAFPSVDALHGELAELASAYPDLMRHHHIGASRLGEPPHAVTVGDGPGDRHAYAKRFYRPLPETRALMRLMDEVRPALVCSLHNGEYQGAFFYLNRDDPTLAKRLATLPGLLGIPIHHGQPELPGATAIGPGAYLTPDGFQVGKLVGAGGSSADYAATFGALHLMPEVPTWADARIGDQSPSGHTHGQILAGQARREVVDTMAASMLAVAGDLSVHSPFRRSTENTLAIFRTLAELDEAVPEPDRPATVAEAFGSRQLLHMMRLRLTGTWFGEAEAEAESPGPPIELRKLVAVQLGAILAAAERVTSGELL